MKNMYRRYVGLIGSIFICPVLFVIGVNGILGDPTEHAWKKMRAFEPGGYVESRVDELLQGNDASIGSLDPRPFRLEPGDFSDLTHVKPNAFPKLRPLADQPPYMRTCSSQRV